MIIDAHQHFWRIDRGDYGWISDEISAIRRDYLPTHLRAYLDHFGIDRTILVQAGETLSDNAFMADCAVEAGFVGGIVAWVDLTAPDIGAHLAGLAALPLIKGIRPVLQGIEDTNWILQPAVISALRQARDLGLRFDALITPRHLEVILQLALEVPDLPIVIDHAAKPVIRAGRPAGAVWRDGMARLAGHDQIHCKLSGLATEFGPGWSAETLAPVADHLLAEFGPERVMWGSDWPVLELEGSYPQWFTVLQALISGRSLVEQAQILGGTARQFYGVAEE